MSMKKGFTLVEAMVAVAIVSLAIVGPMYVANSSIVAAGLASDQLTASYLAQEGIEYIRLMRDDAYLYAYSQDLGTTNNPSLDGWNDFLKGSSPNNPWSIKQCLDPGTNKTCTLDPSQQMSAALSSCNTQANNCSPLYLNSSTGVYSTQSSSGSPTSFTRTIQAFSTPGAIDANGNPIDIRVKSVVTWVFHNSTYSVTVTDHLMPWQ